MIMTLSSGQPKAMVKWADSRGIRSYLKRRSRLKMCTYGILMGVLMGLIRVMDKVCQTWYESRRIFGVINIHLSYVSILL